MIQSTPSTDWQGSVVGPGGSSTAREQHCGGVAPCTGRLRVRPAAWLVVELAGQPDGDLGARRIVRPRRGVQVHRRGAAGEADAAAVSGDRGDEGSARSDHSSRLPAVRRADAAAIA